MHVGAVIAVTDLDRAREFYEGQLGLAGAPTPGGWLVRGDAGSVAHLAPRPGRLGPHHLHRPGVIGYLVTTAPE